MLQGVRIILRKCDNCKVKIPFIVFYKQMLRDKYTYTCVKCGKEHKVTIVSFILFGVLFTIPFVQLMVEKKLLINIVWISISFFVIQPLILQYKIKNTRLKK